MLNITLNTEKNGIELRFDTKPNTDVITAIKEAGFRWSGKQKIWYAKQNDETVALANQISESEGSFEYKPKTETNIDLWSLTRTEGIEDNYGKTRITNTKEIAANIRKHLRNRFSMCKWSVTSDYNSIRVELLESPFSRNSEALKAIINYAYTYAQSWNYNNSDLMTDYFDVNFYGAYKVSYNYNQRECKPNETELETDFLVKKSEFDAEQKKQKEERIKKAVEESKIRQAEYEKAEAEDVQKIKCGQWVVYGFDETYNCYEARCSNCEMELEMNFDGDKPYINLNTAYCPCCGAKMNGWCEDYEKSQT